MPIKTTIIKVKLGKKKLYRLPDDLNVYLDICYLRMKITVMYYLIEFT